MTQRQLRNLDHFNSRCWAVHRRPEDERRMLVAQHCAIKFFWAASLMALFAFLSLISEFIA